MVRMVTLYHPERDTHNVMHVEEYRVEHFEELGWTREKPKGKELPEPSKPAPQRRKPRGTEDF